MEREDPSSPAPPSSIRRRDLARHNFPEVAMSRLQLAGLAAVVVLGACKDAGPLPTVPESPRTVAPRAGDAAADRVTASARWNLRTREIIGRQGGDSNAAARTYALVSVASYDAVIAAKRVKARSKHPSEAAAAGAAAATVLASLYPEERGFIEAALVKDAAEFPTLPSERNADFDAGTDVGRTVGAEVYAYARTDGSDAVWTGTVPEGPGYWNSAPPPATPSGALWGEVRPWLMSSGDQFRSGPPPVFGSPDFLEALAEVRSITDQLTAEQVEIAKFWAGDYGPGGPAGFFGSLATELASGQHLNERRAARVLAVLHMAIMDASIGCYDAKYHYWYIRPYQADPAIKTAVKRPNFPSYPSAHSCLSAAAAGVLSAYFPPASDELRALVQEAGMSRIYGGIHFPFEIEAGRKIGESVAALALKLAPNGYEAIPLR
jgi:hypothetical protein